MQYSVIIFDTAPTGHTLRFLSFPTVLEKALAKVSTLSGRFGPMFQQVRYIQLGKLIRSITLKISCLYFILADVWYDGSECQPGGHVQ